MNIRDMNISKHLQIGLGIIFIFVALLGVTAWLQVDSIWQEVQGLYEHPLTVRRAIGELNANILTMNGDLKDLILTHNVQETQVLLQSLDASEAKAYQQFTILYDRYLGPKSDIDEAHKAFAQWKAVRDEIKQLRRDGKTTEAAFYVSSIGPNGATVDNILNHIKDISNFSADRGDKFFQDAQKQRDDLRVQQVIIIVLIFGLGGMISFYLVKRITGPLADLTTAAQSFRQGRLESRSQYISKNEFGVLATSFNDLAETIQNELQRKEKAAHITDGMLRVEELHAFCQELLKSLIAHTDSQIGAIYLLNQEKTEFEQVETIGLNAGSRTTFSIAHHEGEFGAACITRQIQRITQIPEDTRFTYSAVSGDIKPREIITIPILSGQEVVAMVSLASIRGYSEPAIRLLNDIWSVLTARLNGVLAFKQIHSFSQKLENQNRELETQARELAGQADELSEQNSELELQKKQLGEANRLKSAFLSNMSHELRTPLNSVIALTEVLNRRLRNTIPEEEYSYLEVIERNGKNLLTLINDILDLSRVEAGREEISLSSFSVQELVNDIVEMIAPQAREKNIALINQIREENLILTSDYSKCRHILQNMIGNAVKFTDEGKVVVSAVQSDNDIHISVADTGIGIREDQLPYIFDEFRQADESTSRKYGGSGLGLAIAKKYATLLRGKITVESTPGRGSIFTLRLSVEFNPPALGSQVGQAREISERSSASINASIQSGNRKRILIVEDSEPAIIQLKDILAGQGYGIQVAHNGREALECIGKSLPEVVILDLMMPEVDGFQVLRMIRSQALTALLPVLILTAKQVTKEELAFLKGNHIHQLIQKGDINKKDLLAAVARMFNPPAPEPEAKQVHIPTRRRASGKPSILIVEDNPDNRRTVCALLTDAYIVIEAADGHSGLESTKANLPDLILLDISLPGLDGFEVLDQIRKEETLRHIPVLALTARAMKGDRELILSHGFDGYISKPIDTNYLVKTIDEMMYGD